MPLFKSTTPAAPTHEERLNAAAAQRDAALYVFRAAVDDLHAASAEAVAVETEIGEEITRLVALRDEATRAADESAAKAQHLGSLVG